MEQAGGKMTLGWAARDASGHLSTYIFSRRAPGDDDVTIKVLFCGVCHTDLHVIKNEWGNAMYPVVPGHEVVGIVTDVGRSVTKFKAGDTVGVGYFVDSCRTCESCSTGHENYCPQLVLASNGAGFDGATTRGGFSDVVVVRQDYVAFGMKVTVISSSPGKREEEALDRLGADAFLVSRDPEEMKAAAGTMDGIIDTVSAGHPIVPLLELLKPMGQMVVVGAPSKPLELPAFAIIAGGKRVAGNGVGSIADCQAMLDFAADHGITADVEVILMSYVNTAIERLERNDVRYRFVVDVAGSLAPVA
ncbi:hypothetical protein PR202_ga15911 [Eleusine coracana subsp. coracana]|uniref:cinnamyl-alcohol dehydrogenase n=1 Tax=Eleusine coracana subsp. coracana TaxID=191504 RepID=A0AAV5CL60_ELECO|nr:hypothetical protein PR202_ga15911 [Eleusine coracana subsp. coracana]